MGKHQVRQYEIRQQLHFVVGSTPDILLFVCFLSSWCEFRCVRLYFMWIHASLTHLSLTPSLPDRKVPFQLHGSSAIKVRSVWPCPIIGRTTEPRPIFARNGCIWHNPVQKCSPYDSRLVMYIYIYIYVYIYTYIYIYIPWFFQAWQKKNTGYDWILFESWKTSKINGLRLHPWHGTRIPDMAWSWKGAFNGRKCHPYHNHHSSTIITHHGHPSAKKK